MRVLLVDNAHIYQTPDGQYYSPSIYGDDFFARYLKVFDNVKFVSKVKQISNEEAENLLKLTLNGIEIQAIPWYRGGREFFKNLISVFNAYRGISKDCDCSILRIAQIESFMAFLLSGCRKKPLAVEVVNDPLEFKDMNGIIRCLTVMMTRKILNKADGASYVTKEFLQKKYPCKKVQAGKGFTSFYSSISLYDSDLALYPHETHDSKLCLIHVSNAITSNVKGHIEVLDIVEKINAESVDCDVIFIGEGSAVPEFKTYAENLGIGGKVHFIGRLSSHEKIMKEYKNADIFLLPTKLGEGLPRVIIEAMASGLPCFAAPAGGISELLEDNYIIPASNTSTYATRIINLWKDSDEFKKQSENNIEVARNYKKSILDRKRWKFYKKLYELCRKTNLK